MKTTRKLVIVCPNEILDDITEAFLDAAPALPGFTSFAASGHGQDFAAASAREHVRGHVSRHCIWMILSEPEVKHALDVLRAATCNPHVAYWVEPVLEFGHIPS
ncbi:DUF3240 family protein [Kordiimonas sp.]|uniref:DUF3240 family protein n=1 Tax=Kordiimonas sp. TaxID=1970157 RepID=UPI003A8F1BB7